MGGGSPDAAIFHGNAGWVNIVMCSSRTPVLGAGDGERGERVGVDESRNQHVLSARKNGLADGDRFGEEVIGEESSGTRIAELLLGEGDRDFTIIAAEKAAVHGLRVGICDSIRVPLSHEVTGRASIRTIHAGLAWLIRRKSPSTIHSTLCDGDHPIPAGKFTGPTAISFLEGFGIVGLRSEVFPLMMVGMMSTKERSRGRERNFGTQDGWKDDGSEQTALNER